MAAHRQAEGGDKPADGTALGLTNPTVATAWRGAVDGRVEAAAVSRAMASWRPRAWEC
uniref:DUF834 domain-containing protein n=1 Tax=Oryza sativa subsp. japonica TaxID=39947 RepID=Q69SM4_ORYSJ|nr:hypothetical protein [Oryza sativa Japonica Group]